MYVLVRMLSVVISRISQILLKKSAMGKHKSVLKEYLNPYVIIAYGLFFAATLMTVYSYRGLSLSAGTVIEATGYFFTLVFGCIFFNERITLKKIGGVALILAGIMIYTFSG